MRSAQVPAVQPGLGGSAVAESADRHQERIAGKTSPRTSWASARASVPVSGAWVEGWNRRSEPCPEAEHSLDQGHAEESELGVKRLG